MNNTTWLASQGGPMNKILCTVIGHLSGEHGDILLLGITHSVCRGFINALSRRPTDFHRWAKTIRTELLCTKNF